ncbi:MAG: hypothetical protein HY875_12835 [Chloroflexi bacterium]|nr:hypothetical protein [Chloroflexota bacterium]
MDRLPAHVVVERRDGRKEVFLHRSMAVISPARVEIRGARSTIILPVIALALAGTAGTVMAMKGGAIPFWALVGMLLFCLFAVPLAVMSLIGSIAGAEVIADARKGSITWQQGYLGMGIGTKELVPFDRIDHLEVTIEGDQPDRWRGETDSMRQFALVLVKKSGKRLLMANVPVPPSGQTDGMDRTLAVGNAIAEIAGTTVMLPEGWELVEIDTATGEPAPKPAPAKPRTKRSRR